jgi:hypothetical protein
MNTLDRSVKKALKLSKRKFIGRLSGPLLPSLTATPLEEVLAVSVQSINFKNSCVNFMSV